jgi:putative SOS response-associated peptidase YedK
MPVAGDVARTFARNEDVAITVATDMVINGRKGFTWMHVASNRWPLTSANTNQENKTINVRFGEAPKTRVAAAGPLPEDSRG